ncbi:MAG: hypothetical protein ABIR30_15385 [Chitinophagaceae bacterium]
MKNPFLKTYLFFISIVLFSCDVDKNPCKLPETVLKDIDKIDSLTKLPEIRQRDSIWNFNNYKELSLISAKNETYRFTWHSSFDGVEIYRIEKLNGKYKVVTKKFGDRDTVPSIREFSISSRTWNNIIDSLSINGFWTYPSSNERNGLDGATWILEGFKPIKDECTEKNYHRLTRWSPIDTKFITMCDLFKSLTQE